MKVVLVYPRYPDTFWCFRQALKFISKKATYPPLGLLTVAAMLPKDWDKKLVDMNISVLKDKDLEGADFVFISAMEIQKVSAKEVMSKCKKMGIKIVAGGPLFTTGYKEFSGVNYFVLNEAEITLPLFLEDLRNGYAKHIYTTNEFPDIEKTPIPLWGLIDMKKYKSMNLQYSRGCPFDCEFCDIVNLFGHRVRTKSRDQILAELESLYYQGWRGGVFFVDDNFIGNKRKLKSEILPAMINWMGIKRHPFSFSTETSLDLSDDDELMQLMAKAGFNSVFVGIETPDEKSLAECNKVQNKNRNLVASVKRIQKSGLQVIGGFIVGFDSDLPSIFKRQIEFIQKSGIITAMVGLLNAPRGTKLHQRLIKENRLWKNPSGDNTDFSINFMPKMNYEVLIKGYKRIISKIYSPKPYYERVKGFLKDYKPPQKLHFHFGYIRFHSGYPGAFFKSIWVLGIKDKPKFYYWKLFFWSLFKRPRLFPFAITYAIYGYHFRKIFKEYLRNT
ncbi:MAG: B12-binding domain-containing radical SAM protein [Candidatus Stahlbacteria bacterium]|nr:B12-binding domain-containing radical SAM protein [Candidatus Stahlbacteria bacterium]